MRPLALLLLFAAPVALAAPVPKELKKSGLSRLVGSWKQEAPDVNTWKFSADGTAAITDKLGNKSVGIKFAIDPNTDPVTFDWVCPWGKWYGVCELKGDAFAIYVRRSNGQPTMRNMELKAAPGVEVYRFQRIEADK